jgi:hypothetical protein
MLALDLERLMARPRDFTPQQESQSVKRMTLWDHSQEAVHAKPISQLSHVVCFNAVDAFSTRSC